MSDWFEAEEHADRALEMYERGRWAEAEAELRKALSLNPNQAEWHFNLGLTLEAAGRESEAMGCYEQAVTLMPGQVDPMLAAGIIANRLGRYERAVSWLEQVIGSEPGCEAAYAHLVEAHLRLGDHDDAETAFYMAQQALEDSSAQCLAMMAESLIQREEYARAEWCLREALRIDPTIPRLRARLGSVYGATGRPRRALQMFLRDLRGDPGNIDTLLDYGELLVGMGRLPEAAEKFRRVLELEPANVDAHFQLGEIAMISGRDEQAHLEYELVLKLDPMYPRIRQALAEALLRRGRADDASLHLRDELDKTRLGDVAPAPPMDWARFAGLLLDAGMPSEAAETLQQALTESPNDLDLLRKLALAHFRSGDRDGGVAASRRVLRHDPRCIASVYNVALAALERGRLRFAAGWIARGMRVDRHDDGLRRLRMRLWLRWLGVTARGLIGLRR